MSSSKLFLPALGFAAVLIAGSVDAGAAAPRSKQRSGAWSNAYPHANGAPVRNPYFGAGSTCFRSAGTGRLICSAEDALFDRSKGGRP